MTKTIKDAAELKVLLIQMMTKATSDSNSAAQTFEEQATYIFNLIARNPDPGFYMPSSSIGKYLLTIRVNAHGSSSPISLDDYIENFHYYDTHSSVIETENEVKTTQNSTTMMCKIFISKTLQQTYPMV